MAKKSTARRNVTSRKKTAAKRAKIDALNAKLRNPLTVMLVVSDIKEAISFYKKVFGFEQRGLITGPQGQIVHAELTIRDETHLMLTPAEHGARTPRDVGHSSAKLYLMVDDVDKVVAKAKRLGGMSIAEALASRDKSVRVALVGDAEDMFWGDRRAHILDPDGHDWMVATHVANYSLAQLKGVNIGFSGGSEACFELEAFTASDPPAFNPTHAFNQLARG